MKENLYMFALLFPWMHQELIEKTVPHEVRLLDPGLGLNSPLHWRPQEFTMNSTQAKKYVQQCLDFGAQFQSTGEMAYLNQIGWEDFFSNSAQNIKDELHLAMEPQEKKDNKHMRLLWRQTQMALLLAWSREESLLEIDSLHSGFEKNLHNFYNNLGLEASDKGLFHAGYMLSGNISGQQDLLTSWNKLLPWFLHVIQDRACLFVSNSSIRDEWMENGLQFEPLSSNTFDQLFSDPGNQEYKQKMTAAQAFGWELALHKKAFVDWDWMNIKYTVVVME